MPLLELCINTSKNCAAMPLMRFFNKIKSKSIRWQNYGAQSLPLCENRHILVFVW